MLALALQAGSLATGAPTPGRSLSKQGSMPIDLSTTLPRRNSEDEASWVENTSPSSDGSESETGSPSMGIVDNRPGSTSDTFATHATKKGSGQASHVALDLRVPPAVKKLRQTGRAEHSQNLELAWDFSLSVKATKREAKLSGSYSKEILSNV